MRNANPTKQPDNVWGLNCRGIGSGHLYRHFDFGIVSLKVHNMVTADPILNDRNTLLAFVQLMKSGTPMMLATRLRLMVGSRQWTSRFKGQINSTGVFLDSGLL